MKHKKLLIICPYPENVAPSQRLKFEQYYPVFKNEGYVITTSPFINKSFWKIIYGKGNFLNKVRYTLEGYLRRVADLFRVRKFDVVYVHLWGTPIGPPIYEWLLKKLARSIIYDIDDLVYLKNTESKAHPLITYIKGRQKPICLMKWADHVITCTPHLDKFVKQYNQRTTDISSTVDTDAYQPVNPYTNQKPVTIGWSGSLSTSKYFYLLEDVLKKLAHKYQFNLLVIGDASVKIEGLSIEAVAWTEASELYNLQRIDIGVYPLPNEEWVLGKSGLKAIQYMALGIPTVATAIGANFRVIENEVSGFLVTIEAEWIESIGRLIVDPELRKRMGVAARKKVEAEFSIHANAVKYLAVLEEVSCN